MSNNFKPRVKETAKQWKVRARRDRLNRVNIIRAQDFANDLLDFMESQNITQLELAQRMGISPQQVNKILQAKADLTLETLDKIAIDLGVTISPPTVQLSTNNFLNSKSDVREPRPFEK